VIFDAARQAALDQTAYTQPALFAIEYALADLWKSWGIEPAVVMGHSLGEYVAACVAGLFSLEDAVKLVAARARLMQLLPPIGAMAAVAADLETVQSILGSPRCDCLDSSHQRAGQHRHLGRDPLGRLRTRITGRAGIEVKRLAVSHAFHSGLMDPGTRRVRKGGGGRRLPRATRGHHLQPHRTAD